ncbi:MAG: hypothetical protein E7339_02610 [Clostridiales bacterium]|nr:hypothetical protein [Clostridiales bacterium]
MKFLSKIGAWIASHKLISLLLALVVIVGVVCAILLPPALHKHSFSSEWTYDEGNHWHVATCEHKEKKSNISAHELSNVLYDDAKHWQTCNVCGAKVNEEAHVYNQEIAEAAYLKAEASASGNTQYWKSCECGKPSTTEYFEIQKKEGKVTGIQDLSKTYDKQCVLEPTFVTNNTSGAVTVEWYQGETKLDSAPINAGTYTVKVIVAESATYYEASAEKEFTIAQKEISVLPAITKVYDGTKEFTLTLNGTNGAVEGDEITCSLTVNRKDVKSQNNAVVAWEDEAITSLEYENVNYNITATQITVTITPIDLDVTGISFVKEYDGTNYIEREFSGLLTGETLTLRIIMTSEAVGTKGAENVTTHFFGGSAEAKNYTFGGLSSSEYIEAMKAQAEIKAASN